MKAAFQDSASAFPSSQLITLMKQFTNKCEVDKSSSAPISVSSARLHVSNVQILPHADEKGHKDS